MKIDYQKKYLKYKNKYLLAKVQFGGAPNTPEQYQIIVKLLKLFEDGIPEVLRVNGDMVDNIICVFIKDKETLLTRQKLNLLIQYIYERGDKPEGLSKIVPYMKEPEDEDNSEVTINIRKMNYEYKKTQKNLFYYNLLCKIFDDNINIEEFKEIANNKVILLSLEKLQIIIKLETIFSKGITENLRRNNSVVENIMNDFIKPHATKFTIDKIRLLYAWFMKTESPNGLKTIGEPDIKKKQDKFYSKLLFTIFNDLINMEDFYRLAQEPITLP
jgi:hypothetical protein